MPFDAAYNKEITKEYEAIRFRNRQLLNERIAEIRERVPRIAEIDDEIRDMTIDAALSSLHEEPVDEAELSSHTNKLIEEKYETLTNAGYPADYLSPIYTCSKCLDIGYIQNEPCECLKQKVIQLQYKRSNLGQNFSDESFESFCFDYYSDQPDGIHELSPRANIENVYRSLQVYINGIHDYFTENAKQRGNILFQGNTGVGKTFLSNCLAKELLNQGYSVFYVSAGRLFEQVGDVLMNKHQIPGSQDLYYAVESCDVLVIDDLGTEFPNTFTTSYLYSLLNDRLLRKKATIISTNLFLKELKEHYNERISSRIYDSYLIYNIYGEDIRLAKRKIGS